MAGVRRVRVFVLSLGVLETGRQSAIAVSERLNRVFAGSVWFEVESCGASERPPPVDVACDIAIVIVGAKTDHELLTTLPRASDLALLQERATAGEANDPTLLDLQSRLLKGLIERGAAAGAEPLRAAFHVFATAEELQAQIEKLLRGWVATHIDNAPPFTVAAKPARRRTSILAAIAALAFAVVAAVAAHRWREAHRALGDAEAMIAELVAIGTETVQPHAQLDSVDALLVRVRDALRKLAVRSDDVDIAQQRARANLLLAEIDLERGRTEEALNNANAALASVQPLAEAGNLEARHLRAQAERLLGAIDWELTSNPEAHRHFERGIAELADLLERGVDPKISWRWMRSLADLHQSMGEMLLFRFDKPREALQSFDKARELRLLLLQLGHSGPSLQRDLAWITKRRGDVEYRLGNDETAAGLYLEARARLDTLQERIWEDLKWVADLGVIDTNIGMIKRRQKRFSEAETIFARGEQLLATVHKRDPKNFSRALALNRTRYLRAENLFRWALASNDRMRLIAVRDRIKSVIEFHDSIAALGAPRRQVLHNAARETALLSAIDATLRQLNGNFEGAAAGYSEAAEAIAKTYLLDARNMPRPDLLRENIEYLEWAGIAYARAQKAPEAELQFKRALSMLAEYRSMLEPTIFDEFQKRIEARF
jgi:tetratricopeptide (TPR) repeat protein